MIVKALSLWQPWASLLACRLKRIETRSWPFPRGLALPCVVAIHATKTWGKGHDEDDYEAICLAPRFREALAGCGYESPAAIPRGCILGLGVVAGCWPTADLVDGRVPEVGCLTAEENAFGDYSPGRFGWLFPRVRLFGEPIPQRGGQGLWEWDAPAECDGWIEGVLNEASPRKEGA